jgi:hypothetical protein
MLCRGEALVGGCDWQVVADEYGKNVADIRLETVQSGVALTVGSRYPGASCPRLAHRGSSP